MCGCNSGSNQPSGITSQWEVRLPDGTVKVVSSEADGRIEMTIAGGGSMRKR